MDRVLDESDTFVFIHSMRTGGTSIRDWLKIRQIGGEGLWHHSDLKSIQKFTDSRWKILAVARNPFAREFSLWKYYKKSGEFWEGKYDKNTGIIKKGFPAAGGMVDNTLRAALEMDFNDFMIHRYNISHDYGGIAVANFPAGPGQVSSVQANYIKTTAGRPYKVFKFENLEKEFIDFTAQFNLEPKEFPHCNATNQTNYQDHYTTATRDLVASHEQNVLQLFKYIF